jgi:uncharacterized protein (TIGR02444 family)
LSPPNHHGSRLWDYAFALYGRPGAEAGWLALQDEHGQCVSFLIWRLWAQTEGRPVDAGLLQAAVGVASTLDCEVIAGVRAVRRRLAAPLARVDEGARAALREAAKRLELDAERALLETLEAMTPPPSEPAAPSLQVLREAASAWGAPLSWVAAERLGGLIS